MLVQAWCRRMAGLQAMNQQIVTTICCDSQCALLERVKNYLLEIQHDLNYMFFVVSVLSHTTGGGVRALFEGEVLILNFGRQDGHLFEGSTYLRGGTNSRIYSNLTLHHYFVYCPFPVSQLHSGISPLVDHGNMLSNTSEYHNFVKCLKQVRRKL